MKTRLWKIIFAILLLPVCANAVPITIAISGNVTSASGSGLPSTIYVGSTFTGTYTYDTNAPDSDPIHNKFGEYWYDSPYGISVFLGGYEFKTAQTHIEQFSVTLDMYYGNRYYYRIKSYQNITTLTGTSIEEISWVLGDSTRTVPSSDILPVTAPLLTSWDYNVFRIIGEDNSLQIIGTVTQAVLIPEPVSVVLMAMGIFFLNRRR